LSSGVILCVPIQSWQWSEVQWTTRSQRDLDERAGAVKCGKTRRAVGPPHIRLTAWRINTVDMVFNVVIERDAEGFHVATVPALRGCHTQARSLDVLMDRVREAIEVCLEVDGFGH